MKHGHGRSGKLRTQEYNAWQNMLRRCYNPRSLHKRKYYGARIGVCDRWRSSFVYFLEDMGRKPSSKHSLDRLDPDKDYGPGNCRWATPEQQNEHGRKSKQPATIGMLNGLLSFGM